MKHSVVKAGRHPADKSLFRRRPIHPAADPELPCAGEFHNALCIEHSVYLSRSRRQPAPAAAADQSDQQLVLSLLEKPFRNLVFSRRILISSLPYQNTVDIRVIAVRHRSKPQRSFRSRHPARHQEPAAQPDTSDKIFQSIVCQKARHPDSAPFVSPRILSAGTVSPSKFRLPGLRRRSVCSLLFLNVPRRPPDIRLRQRPGFLRQCFPAHPRLCRRTAQADIDDSHRYLAVRFQILGKKQAECGEVQNRFRPCRLPLSRPTVFQRISEFTALTDLKHMNVRIFTVLHSPRITVSDPCHRQLHIGLAGAESHLSHIDVIQADPLSGCTLHRHQKRPAGAQILQIYVKSAIPAGGPAGSTVLQPYSHCLPRTGKTENPCLLSLLQHTAAADQPRESKHTGSSTSVCAAVTFLHSGCFPVSSLLRASGCWVPT